MVGAVGWAASRLSIFDMIRMKVKVMSIDVVPEKNNWDLRQKVRKSLEVGINIDCCCLGGTSDYIVFNYI